MNDTSLNSACLGVCYAGLTINDVCFVCVVTRLVEARRAETLGYLKRRAEGTRKGPRAKA